MLVWVGLRLSFLGFVQYYGQRGDIMKLKFRSVPSPICSSGSTSDVLVPAHVVTSSVTTSSTTISSSSTQVGGSNGNGNG